MSSLLCAHEHHMTHFMQALVQKAAEITVKGNTLSFGSEALLLQAKQLKLNEPRKKPSRADPAADAPQKKLRGTKAEKKRREKNVKGVNKADEDNPQGEEAPNKKKGAKGDADKKDKKGKDKKGAEQKGKE